MFVNTIFKAILYCVYDPNTVMELWEILVIAQDQDRDNAYVALIWGSWRALSDSTHALNRIVFCESQHTEKIVPFLDFTYCSIIKRSLSVTEKS